MGDETTGSAHSAGIRADPNVSGAARHMTPDQGLLLNHTYGRFVLCRPRVRSSKERRPCCAQGAADPRLRRRAGRPHEARPRPPFPDEGGARRRGGGARRPALAGRTEAVRGGVPVAGGAPACVHPIHDDRRHRRERPRTAVRREAVRTARRALGQHALALDGRGHRCVAVGSGSLPRGTSAADGAWFDRALGIVPSPARILGRGPGRGAEPHPVIAESHPRAGAPLTSRAGTRGTGECPHARLDRSGLRRDPGGRRVVVDEGRARGPVAVPTDRYGVRGRIRPACAGAADAACLWASRTAPGPLPASH